MEKKEVLKNKIETEKQLVEALNIDSLEKMDKNSIEKFVTLLPQMDKDLALKTLESLPDYMTNTKEMILAMKNLCDNAIKDAGDNTRKAIDTYNKVLDQLSKIINTRELTPEELKYYSEKMIEIADRVSKKDSEDKKFKYGVIGGISAFFTAVIGVGAAILLGKKKN